MFKTKVSPQKKIKIKTQRREFDYLNKFTEKIQHGEDNFGS